MPYNLSRRVCQKHEGLLQQMADQQKSFTVACRDPIKKARQVREAMEAVKHHDDYATRFGHLGDCYRVNSRKGAIELEWLGKPIPKRKLKEPTAPMLEDLPAELEAFNPEPAPPESMRVEAVSELLHVIGAVIKLQETTDELYFPDAALDLDEQIKLYEWCKAKGWHYIDHEGAGLTLTKRAVDPFILWEPPTEETV